MLSKPEGIQAFTLNGQKTNECNIFRHRECLKNK